MCLEGVFGVIGSEVLLCKLGIRTDRAGGSPYRTFGSGVNRRGQAEPGQTQPSPGSLTRGWDSAKAPAEPGHLVAVLAVTFENTKTMDTISKGFVVCNINANLRVELMSKHFPINTVLSYSVFSFF